MNREIFDEDPETIAAEAGVAESEATSGKAPKAKRLCIERINAAVRKRGLGYSQFIAGLEKCGCDLDLRTLAEMAVRNPTDFDLLVARVRSDLDLGAPASVPRFEPAYDIDDDEAVAEEGAPDEDSMSEFATGGGRRKRAHDIDDDELATRLSRASADTKKKVLRTLAREDSQLFQGVVARARALGLNKSGIARAIGVSPATITNLGDATSWGTVKAIATLLNTSTDDLEKPPDLNGRRTMPQDGRSPGRPTGDNSKKLRPPCFVTGGGSKRTRLTGFPPAKLKSSAATLLAQPITKLALSARTGKCTTELRITTIGELVSRTAEDLMECKKLGVSSLLEVREKLAEHGLKLRGD